MLVMKKHAVHILMVIAALAMGMAYRYRGTVSLQPAGEDATPIPAQVVNEPRKDVHAAIPPPPKPVTEKPEPMAPSKIVAPRIKEQPKAVMPIPRPAAHYWQQAARRFEQQGEMLSQETDPAKRMNLIQTMARNVRIDTLSTLDWAMSLEDPAEQRAAMEAINKNALVGIGARIQVDETGLPKIVDTTVLSAVASTGMTEPGDYISGMVNGDGSTIYFQDLPVREIVKLLHGQPGTEIQLLMERAPADGDTEPYSFDVPLRRSMIIMQPPD